MKNKLKASTQKIRIRSFITTINLLMISSVITLAMCEGWELFQTGSVRFSNHSTEREFYRLPPLPDYIEPKTGQWKSRERVWAEGSDESESKTKIAESEQLWKKANASEQAGDLTGSVNLLRDFLKVATEENQSMMNSANDRLDAIDAMNQGASKAEVRKYLALRLAFDDALDATLVPEDVSSVNVKAENSSVSQKIKLALETLEKSPPPRCLQDNYAYLKAAFLYLSEEFEGAQAAFQNVAFKYPKSEKREAAMYMASVVSLKISNREATDECGANIGSNEADRSYRRATCQNGYWLTALVSMNQLVKEYPHGKFTYATYENRAYLFRLGGELALGIADYYRMLGHPSNVNVRLKGKSALRFMGEDFGTDSILNQIEEELADDPHAALAYSYHRIYNHAVDYSYDSPSRYWSNDYNENQKEEERIKESLNKGNGELRRVINFATKLMHRYPNSAVSSGFVLRVGQAQLELQDFHEARLLSSKALLLGANSDLKAEALWIKGSAEHRLKDFKSAKSTFTQLVSEFPHSNLTEGARRLLAMNAEDSGNLEEALEHYIALKYEDDIAYYIDVLLTPEQLAEFIRHHPKLENPDVYWYSLGLKYLRLGQWGKARAQFSRIQTTSCKIEYSRYGDGKPKNPKWEYSTMGTGEGVCSEWLLSDLKTTDDLARLEKEIELAQGDEAKAEAMYQFASYQYQNSQLLFYNPAIWGGTRHSSLASLDVSNNFRLPNEAQNLYDYMQSHENLSRAIPTYLELARLYPNTRAAKDGLYTAVVAHRRLATNYNDYWRKLYNSGLQAGGHLVTFRDVRSLYPKYQMPRAEMGWEPITRTVNGGPGWSAPPKPLPKLTRSQKFKRYLKRFDEFFKSKIQSKIDSATESYTTYLWRCLTAVLIAFSLIFTWYGSVLSFHFWKQRKPLLREELSILSGDDSPSSETSDSESRVEKIINDHL